MEYIGFSLKLLWQKTIDSVFPCFVSSEGGWSGVLLINSVLFGSVDDDRVLPF